MRHWSSLFLLVFCVVGLLQTNIRAQVDDEEFVQEGFEETKPASDKDPVKLFMEGQDAHEKGDLDRALELYAEAIEVYPEFPEAEYQRGTYF